MKYVLIGTLVALSLSSIPSQADENAMTFFEDRTITLTNNKCRYMPTLKEAMLVDSKDMVTYQCYWFGREDVYFETQTIRLWWIKKSKFKPSKDLI